MKLTKHNSYKNFDNPLLDKLPSNWSVIRIKDVVSINSKSLTEKTTSDYTFKYIDIGNVNVSGVIAEPELIDFGSAPSRARRIVKKNDVIISTVRTYLKAVAFFQADQKDIIVSTGFAVLSANKKIEPNYLAYLVRSEAFIDNVIRYSIGVSYPAINTATLASLPISIPGKFEQKVISNFLNQKTTAIDKKIALLETKISSYKELSNSLLNEAVCKGLKKNVPVKSSGIEWIGEIPKHWQVKRLKDVGYLYSGLSGKTGEHFNQAVSDNSQYYIPFTNIANNKYINHEDLHTVLMEENEKQNKVKKNDLFFLMSSEGFADIGKAALLIEDVKDTYLNSFCKGFRITKKSVVPKYLNYLLNSPAFREKFIVQGKGFTRINLKMEKVSDFEFIIPPVDEQNVIAEYLDRKTSTIEAIIANIKLQIDSLKELRKSLINDVATGKLLISK